MSLTNVRDYSQAAIAKKWQVDKGTPVTPDLFFKNCAVTPLRNRTKLKPKGSDGLAFQGEEGVIESHAEPMISAKYMLSPTLAAFLMESLMQGATAVNNAGLTETGDADNELATWAFAGIRPYINTDAAGKIYAELSDDGGTRTVNIYKDSGKVNLIATGTSVGDGTATLAESNDSGVTGSVAITYNDGETLVTLEIKVITYAFAVQPTKYFSFAYDDGIDKVTYSDCLTESMTLAFGPEDSVEVTEEIISLSDWVKGASSLTPTGIDTTYFGMRDLDLRDDPDSGNTQMTIENFEFSFTRNYVKTGKSSLVATHAIQESKPELSVKASGKPADEYADIWDDSIALTFNDMKATLTRGTADILELLFKNMDWNTEIPGFDPEGPNFEDWECDGEPQSSSSAEDAFQPTLKINQS